MSHCGAVLLWNDLDGKEMGVPALRMGSPIRKKTWGTRLVRELGL